MSLLAVGLSHQTAPVAMLERVAPTGDGLVKALHELYRADHVAEVMVISTCNRVEVYADVDKFHAGLSEVSELLALHAGVALDQLTPHLFVHYEDRAIQHLFEVVTGLDSMVVGEAQILGQVRTALKLAQREGTLGRVLNEFGQQALRVGKRAHTETGIGQAGRSMVTFGLTLAAAHLRPFGGIRALVVGAGSMSSLAASTLDRQGAGEIVVANRTFERAARLAGVLNRPARAVPLGELGAALAGCDLVISCTGAGVPVIGAEQVGEVMASRPDRPLVLLDLALPRDVEPDVATVPGVRLIDLEMLRTAAQESAEETATGAAAAIAAARRIVAEEVAAYTTAARAARVAPMVVALRTMAAGVVEAELTRVSGRLPDLDERGRAEIALALRRVVDKLLHAPTVRVKELAGSPGGDTYADALRELFDLDPKNVEAVTRVDLIKSSTPDPPYSGGAGM